MSTYEFLPPSFTEEAVPLRTNGLIVLNDLDDQVHGIMPFGYWLMNTQNECLVNQRVLQ